MRKKRIGILGATGVVGQRHLTLLEHHPWFEVTHLAASSQSAGQLYRNSVEGRWHLNQKLPKVAGELPLHQVGDLASAVDGCDLLFSALGGEAAAAWEERYAAAGLPVISHSATHRMASDVPLVIPEINSSHLARIEEQKRRRGWDQGFIVAKPNCSIQSYLLPLFALHQKFRLRHIAVTTMQALSGAGYPGVAASDILANVIPFIRGEEEKSQLEPRKILGSWTEAGFMPSEEFTITAHCNRVPVLDGHMACVSFSCQVAPTRDEILELWHTFRAEPQLRQLPTAPAKPLLVAEEEARPQPRLDAEREGGMAVIVGRLRPDPLFQWKFVGLSHNAVRGAAGGALLVAELLHLYGY